MMTVNEVSKLTGVSIRTLQYYDAIGLLHPSGHTESGYRLYDDKALERLQQILLFRELEFSLKEIREIVNASNFDRNKALEQQIELLTIKKEHLEELIEFTRKIKEKGEKIMDFNVFDTEKLNEYAKRAKAQWGECEEYKEYEKKALTDDEKANKAKDLMHIFAEFGEMKNLDVRDEKVQLTVKKLQDFITKNFYNCTDKILCELGKMYAESGEFTENIDAAGGCGTAEFASKAIEIYCKK